MSRRWRLSRGGGGGRWVALSLALVAGAVLRLPTAERRDTARFPHVSRAALAHLLADFTAHPHGAGGAAWRLEEERGNYTWWTYRVSFTCGDRCTGQATIAATDHQVEHRVTFCTTLALFPWFTYCDEVEVESMVSAAAGAGSVLSERATARCGAARVLVGRCASMLDEHRASHRAAVLARVQSAAASRSIGNIS